MRWKTLFYDLALPLVRGLGPACADRVMEAAGRLFLELPPWRLRILETAVREAAAAAAANWPIDSTAKALARGIPRFLARDYPLEALSDRDALDRFEVEGFDPIEKLISRREGLILVGGHFGAHLAAIHWLFRRGLHPKLLVQRPVHVSRYLARRLDACPLQRGLFLRRDLSTAEAAARVLQARDALKSGEVIYLAGDIPLCGANSRPGRLLGRDLSFLSVWADLAAHTQAPTAHIFCSHLPAGRFKVGFEPPKTIARGEEPEAVNDYLRSLEARIRAEPAEAVCHLLWDCYRNVNPPLGTCPIGRSKPLKGRGKSILHARSFRLRRRESAESLR